MATVFFQRIEALCSERGITPTELGVAAGIGNGTVTGWRKGAIPQLKTLVKLAEFFNVSKAYLEGKTDDPIDYAKIDTSSFDLTRYDHFLKKCKGNVEQANREYIEFERVEAQEALSDPHRPAIYQNNGGTVGVQGHAHAPVTISNGSERTLSSQEGEILRIFSELTLVEQSRVIVYAAELKEKRSIL